MKDKTVSLPGVIVLLAALALFFSALTIQPLDELSPTSDAAFPVVVSGIGVLLAVSILVGDLRRAKKGVSPQAEPSLRILDRDVVVLIGLMALYGVLLYLIGYILSTLVFTVLAVGYLHERNWKQGLLIGFISTFMIVLVFKYGFSVILP